MDKVQYIISRLRVDHGFDLDAVEKWMQGHFSGPYTIREYYFPEHNKYYWKLVFENEKEELVWKLKWL